MHTHLHELFAIDFLRYCRSNHFISVRIKEDVSVAFINFAVEHMFAYFLDAHQLRMQINSLMYMSIHFSYM